MARSVRQIAKEIVAREGGFVDDPDDPGGATKYGVTIHTMERLGLDLNRDGEVDEEDVRALTRARAVDIFVEHYFEKPRLGLLPEALQASVFDMYVNAGANAVRILQTLLAEFGEPVTVDGGLGYKTASAAGRVYDKAGDYLVDAYAIARRNYYYRLAEGKPKLRKFAVRADGGKGGWITRAEEFMAEKYRLTEADHKERVAAW